MRSKLLFVVLGALFALTAAYARDAAPEAPTKVEIGIEGFPLVLDVLKPMARSASPYRAEGVARVEGSDLIIHLAPGSSLPEGGLVVDKTTRISEELAAALGLPSTVRVDPGIYQGTVYNPPPLFPAFNARGKGDIKGGIEVSIKTNIGKC